MLIAFQWVFLFIALLAVCLGIFLKRRKSWSVRMLVVWCVFWLFATGITLFPNTASQVAAIVGIGRGVDLVVYAAITLLFALLFRAEVRFDRLEKQLTVLVRDIALKNVQK